MISLYMAIPRYKMMSILLLTATYLFVILTHILILPNHHLVAAKSQPRYNSIFKRKLENVSAQALSTIHLADKTVLNKDQFLQTLIARLAASFLTLIFLARTLSEMKAFVPINKYISPHSVFRLSLRI